MTTKRHTPVTQDPPEPTGVLDVHAAHVVLAAACNGSGVAANVRGDLAELQADGRIRLSLKRETGHDRVLVRVPVGVAGFEVEPA